MDNMVEFCKDSHGRKWYICRDCGHKEMYKATFCPNCKNTERNTNPKLQQAIELLIATGKGNNSVF